MSRFGYSLAIGIAAGVALATFNSVSAQEAASAFTVDNVAVVRPFGDLPIDRSRIPDHLQDLGGFLGPFSDAAIVELRQRCVVISGNADLYDENSVNLCNAVLAMAGD